MSNDLSYQEPFSEEIVNQIRRDISFKQVINEASAKSSKDILLARSNDTTSYKYSYDDSEKFPDISKNKLKISFDIEIKEEMFQNISFQKFIMELEYLLFLFMEKCEFSLEFRLSYQKDWEVENVYNTLLLLKIYEMDFKEELKIWKDLSQFIRKGFRNSEFLLKNRNHVKDFEEYINLFYIKLKLE